MFGIGPGILDDEDFRSALGDFYLHKVYERLREPADDATA